MTPEQIISTIVDSKQFAINNWQFMEHAVQTSRGMSLYELTSELYKREIDQEFKRYVLQDMLQIDSIPALNTRKDFGDEPHEGVMLRVSDSLKEKMREAGKNLVFKQKWDANAIIKYEYVLGGKIQPIEKYPGGPYLKEMQANGCQLWSDGDMTWWVKIQNRNGALLTKCTPMQQMHWNDGSVYNITTCKPGETPSWMKPISGTATSPKPNVEILPDKKREAIAGGAAMKYKIEYKFKIGPSRNTAHKEAQLYGRDEPDYTTLPLDA